jgi:hypothetical protein
VQLFGETIGDKQDKGLTTKDVVVLVVGNADKLCDRRR